uniref:aECM cysteine-cradle domain-containing protein n=1 Tax=Panagrolaimus superbus TaxID=310955 RepID=A0A914ZCB0_9BILA
MIEQGTKAAPIDLGNILKTNAFTTTTMPSSSGENVNTKFVISDELARRIEQARQLREEQKRLEILASKERDVQLEAQAERRRIIEEKLARLAQTERWQHELLEKAQLRQRAFANANMASSEQQQQNTKLLLTLPPSTITSTQTIPSTTTMPLTTIISSQISESESEAATTLPDGMPQHCAPVQKFLTVFKVKDPKQWLRENCVFVKQYFPSASCSQIEALLSACFISASSEQSLLSQ